MSKWVTDTHAILWHLYVPANLSQRVKAIFDGADQGNHEILVPSITLVEVTYLSEKGRISQKAFRQIMSLLTNPSDNYTIAPLNRGVAVALPKVGRNIVPDMPDRIIAATALHLKLLLLTRDRKIQSAPNVTTVW